MGEHAIPFHRGEMNFVLRGCYSSAARLKFLYRQSEAAVSRAERTAAVIAATLPGDAADMLLAWNGVLFNSFHDILPGTSIERALKSQAMQLGSAIRRSQEVELDALNALASQVDTRVLPPPAPDMPTGLTALVWNPHPRPFRGFVELEGCLDYRPIAAYEGRLNALPVSVLDHRKKALPFQLVDTEHSAFPALCWRKRAVVPVNLPAMGWSMLEMAWVEGGPAPRPPKAHPATSAGAGMIDNGLLRMEAKQGSAGVRIVAGGKPLLSGAGLGAVICDDPWGAWGDQAEGAGTHVTTVRETFKVASAAILEEGPWRAALWVRLSGRRSRVDLVLWFCQ